MNALTVGITGAEGFIGQHLARGLATDPRFRVVPCPRESWQESESLERFATQCDAVVHLAGINRGSDEDVSSVNLGLIERLLSAASQAARPPHILFASSTQRNRDTTYARVKQACETKLSLWAHEATGRRATALVIPNVYGPGCRPFYNSVVATFCHQLTHDIEPTITSDVDEPIDFIWVNDLVDQVSEQLCSLPSARMHIAHLRKTGSMRVAQLLAMLAYFRHCRFVERVVPELSDRFEASLYATFESYFELVDHCWQPTVHRDDRGRLMEIVKLAGGGQVFFSTTKPGVTRGNHYHTRKIEWFCVLAGQAAIRLRRIGSREVREFRVTGESPQFISIPVWHTHQIENIGDRDLLTMFWTSEIFDANDPDTRHELVA